MFLTRLINKILRILRITRAPVVKLYDGYGDAGRVIVQGHVLRFSPIPRKRYRGSVLINLFALIRLFIVAPQKNAKLLLEWEGGSMESQSGKDGAFVFEWKPEKPFSAGWHPVSVSYLSNHVTPVVLAKGHAVVFIPHIYQYSFISDIDDTFLISHSTNIFKRLFVLFTKNARSRKPFADVVAHYRLLAAAGLSTDIPNPFFYVSSSEWNLYDYIREFCRKEELPRGVFLLSRMKGFRDLLKTGQGKHSAKYTRIARILESYPGCRHVLLGDNSQEDPVIYSRIVADYPGKVYCVYIRMINKSKAAATLKVLEQIREAGVMCCSFSHSSEAIAHSKEVGLC